MTSAVTPKPRRRWPKRLLVLAFVASACYLFRGPILRGAGAFLVSEKPVEPAEYVVLLDLVGGRHKEAARLHATGDVPRVLLVERRPGRLQKLGVLPTHEATARRELRARGVPEDRVEVVPCDGFSDWQRARSLGQWLRAHLEVRLTALCTRFTSRRWGLLLERVLPAEDVARIRLHGVDPEGFDESNWWQHKAGVIEIFDGYLRYGYVKLAGEDAKEWREWDPDEAAP